MELIILWVLGVLLLAAGIVYACAKTEFGKRVGIGIVVLVMVANCVAAIIVD